jgi:hypothetical protein
MYRVEVNATTGEVLEIELTPEEVKEREAFIATVEARKQAEAQAEADKAIAKSALLTKLGITEDEAKLLLS